MKLAKEHMLILSKFLCVVDPLLDRIILDENCAVIGLVHHIDSSNFEKCFSV